MKIKDGFVMRDVMGQSVVVATGEASKTFSGMIKLNETGKIVWESISDGKSKDEIVERIIDEFEVDKARAESGVNTFINNMVEKGFIEE